jgi:hypothetical protein
MAILSGWLFRRQAMKAGVADHIWTLEEVIALLT